MTIEEALIAKLLILQVVFKSLQEDMFCVLYTEDGSPIPENIERSIKLLDAWNNITDTIELLKMTPKKKEI